MSHANSFDEDFAPEDDFFEPSPPQAEDPFMDVAAIERRILGLDEPEPEIDPSELSEAEKPFGARLAEANADPAAASAFGDGEPVRPVADQKAYEPRPGEKPLDPELLASVAPAVYEVEDEDDGAPIQPLPRINIHAFCERPETGALIHRAGEDRRLSKAHVTVELGGLSAAIERFHDESTPNLLIIETGMRGPQLFAQLEELAGVCEPDTKLVIVGAANDIGLYRELMRRGVSEYLVPPMSPVGLIRTISELFLDPDQPFAGRSIAFIGAKGGVGSSTVAHNVSWHITETQMTDAVLVDLDLAFGTGGLDFNQDPAQTISDALGDPDRLDDALLDRLLVRCTEHLSLFSAPATLEKDWDFGPEAFDAVIDKVRRQAPFVTLDLPHAWNPWVRETILAADQVVVTVTPDLACLRNAKNLFDLVRQRRPNDEPPKVVVNMAGCPKRPDIPVKDFAEALGTEPVLVLPFEPALFGKAANNGQMIAEVEDKSRPAEGFSHLAGVLTGRTTVSAARRGGLFGKLLGKG
jgi:pilus assembly protein CpaE